MDDFKDAWSGLEKGIHDCDERFPEEVYGKDSNQVNECLNTVLATLDKKVKEIPKKIKAYEDSLIWFNVLYTKQNINISVFIGFPEEIASWFSEDVKRNAVFIGSCAHINRRTTDNKED